MIYLEAMQENYLHPSTFSKNQPDQPFNSVQRPNYWKTGFVMSLITLFLALGLLAYFVKNNNELSNKLAKSVTECKTSINPSITPLANQQQNTSQGISIKIDPYRLDNEQGRMIATFQITNLNKEISISKVTYWTDKIGACKAKTQEFSEFIKIPAEEINDYVFFQFSDAEKGISEIYASSPNPIFQCGDLTE